MPKEFDDCVKGGGRVRTVKPNADSYLHVCNDGSGSHSGEVKYKKAMANGGRVTRDASARYRARLPEGCD
jgi:hypothetical protein